jgi:hypothetical protein
MSILSLVTKSDACPFTGDAKLGDAQRLTGCCASACSGGEKVSVEKLIEMRTARNQNVEIKVSRIVSVAKLAELRLFRQHGPMIQRRPYDFQGNRR